MTERKKKYDALYKNPEALFDGCMVVLFPFTLNEIWIGDGKTCGYRLVAEKTKNGICLHITNFQGAPPIEVHQHSDSEVDVCQNTNGNFERHNWPQTRVSQIQKALEN